MTLHLYFLYTAVVTVMGRDHGNSRRYVLESCKRRLQDIWSSGQYLHL